MYDALNAGIVDGVSAIDPYYGKLEQIGYVVGNPDESLPKNTLTSVYASMRDWTDSHKQTVAAFRQSLQEAIAYIDTHDAEARAAIVKYTKTAGRGRRGDPLARAAGDRASRAGAILHRCGQASGLDQIEPRRGEDDRALIGCR